MRHRSDVAPATLSVEVTDGGVTLRYLDGREVFYHGRPDPVAGPVRTGPRVDVHVLVTDEAATEGVVTYVNDRATHDEVLESTGVGRVLLDPGEREQLFPGVVVEMDGYAPVVRADPEVVGGRVFVFEENQFGERSVEIVDDTDGDADTGGEAGTESEAGPDVGADTGDGTDTDGGEG